MLNDATLKALELLQIGVIEHNGQMLIKLNEAADQFEVDFGAYTGQGHEWVHYTRNLVDCWIDASNHNWMYHEPILESDWVPIAKEVIQGIKNQENFEPVKLRGKQFNKF